MNQKITMSCAVAVCCATSFFAAGAIYKRSDAAQTSFDDAQSLAADPVSRMSVEFDDSPEKARTEGQSIAQNFGQATAQNPIKRMKAILSNPSPAIRMEEWTQFITSLDSSHIEELIQNYPVREVHEPYLEECKALYRIWGQKDPQVAIVKANQECHFFRITALIAVTASWASDDPEAASSWVQNQEGLPQNWRIALASMAEKQKK